jgi:hypothetical protein
VVDGIRKAPNSRQRKVSEDRQRADAGHTSNYDCQAISVSTLHDWRRKHYFPEPKHHCRGLWFGEKQVLLLKNLKQFFRVYGKRPWNVKRERLKEVVASICANWN